MREVTIKVYSFDELNENAKARAIANERDILIQLNLDYIENDFEEILSSEYDLFKGITLHHRINYRQTDMVMFECSNIVESVLKEDRNAIEQYLYIHLKQDEKDILERLLESGLKFYSQYCYGFKTNYFIDYNCDFRLINEDNETIVQKAIDLVKMKYDEICLHLLQYSQKQFDVSDKDCIYSIYDSGIEYLEDGTQYIGE